MDPSVVQKLMDEFPCRNSEIKEILKAEFSPDHFFIYGPSGTGKTAILRRTLELQADYIFINCKECYSPEVFYLCLLRNLFGRVRNNFKKAHSLYDCLNIFERNTLRRSKLRYIVLKNIEAVPEQMLALLAFHEHLLQKGWQFYFIFVTECWDAVGKLLVKMPNRTIVTFDSYTQDQLLDVMLHLHKDKYDYQLLRNFLDLFLPVAILNYRDIGDFIRMTDDLFPVYKKPVDESKLKIDDVTALSRNIRPYLKKLRTDLIYIYSHLESNEDEVFAVELPVSTKLLIIASYIASNIPPKDDQKLFSRLSTKKKKRHLAHAGKSAKYSTSKGSKSFQFSRLMAIYFAITGDKPCMSTNLITQVGTLVDLKLLKPVGEGNLDSPGFKCYANFDLVNTLSKSVGIDVQKYVHE